MKTGRPSMENRDPSALYRLTTDEKIPSNMKLFENRLTLSGQSIMAKCTLSRMVAWMKGLNADVL